MSNVKSRRLLVTLGILFAGFAAVQYGETRVHRKPHKNTTPFIEPMTFPWINQDGTVVFLTQHELTQRKANHVEN